MKPIAFGIVIFFLCVACATRQDPPVGNPAETREGKTSVRVLHDESGSPGSAELLAERVTPAYASDENRLPEYPKYALKAGCQNGILPIRLYVGVDGNVAKAIPMPSRPVAEDQCHSAFWAATWSAVQSWRFSPSFRQTPRPGPDLDGDGHPDLTRWEQTPIMVHLDFEFTFRVVGGRGQVISR